jgi:type I restriction enzyme S subunit
LFFKEESIIFRRYNSHYEKRGKTERCIDDEIPFEIPESWAWVRLGEIIQLISGQDLTPDEYSTKEEGIPYLTGASNIENGEIILNRWTTDPKAIAILGDLLITCKGTIGAMAFLLHHKAHIARQIMAIRVNKLINDKYVKVFLDTYINNLKVMAKSMIPGISRDDILLALIPLPPLSEQKRITSVIDSLLSFYNRLNKY